MRDLDLWRRGSIIFQLKVSEFTFDSVQILHTRKMKEQIQSMILKRSMVPDTDQRKMKGEHRRRLAYHSENQD
jgi:hypothetical protein